MQATGHERPESSDFPGLFRASDQKSTTAGMGTHTDADLKINTSITELVNYFDLPINAAAAALKICPTVLKKICRRHGLQRWPNRKLKSINRNLESLKFTLSKLDQSSSSEAENLRRDLLRKISGLEEERCKICRMQPSRRPT